MASIAFVWSFCFDLFGVCVCVCVFVFLLVSLCLSCSLSLAFRLSAWLRSQTHLSHTTHTHTHTFTIVCVTNVHTHLTHTHLSLTHRHTLTVCVCAGMCVCVLTHPQYIYIYIYIYITWYLCILNIKDLISIQAVGELRWSRLYNETCLGWPGIAIGCKDFFPLSCVTLSPYIQKAHWMTQVERQSSKGSFQLVCVMIHVQNDPIPAVNIRTSCLRVITPDLQPNLHTWLIYNLVQSYSLTTHTRERTHAPTLRVQACTHTHTHT